MEIVWLIAGVVLGGMIAWFMAKSKFATGNQSEQALNEHKTRLTLAEERKERVDARGLNRAAILKAYGNGQ